MVQAPGRLSGFMPQHDVTDKEALAARYLMQTLTTMCPVAVVGLPRLWGHVSMAQGSKKVASAAVLCRGTEQLRS